jgi:signal transduction histidine kinase
VAKNEVSLKRVDLKSFVATLLADATELKPELIAAEVSDGIPPVLAHEAYLAQVFTNLLGNAQKFVRPDTAIQIIISAQLQGDFVRLEIKDNGIGIEPEHFERIFSIFGRIHADTKYEGTGIGLAIVQKAVQRMGGKVGVESVPGHGTTFWFTLRVA